MTADPRQVAYQEIQGGFDPASAEPKTRDEVHLSNIVRLHVQGRSCDGLWVRYVARGQENYRVDGRAYSVKAGQLFISTQSHGVEVEITPNDRSGTLGLCVFLYGADASWLASPLVGIADCHEVGTLMQKSVGRLLTDHRGKSEFAVNIVQSLNAELPNFARQVIAQAAAGAAVKQSTRGEMVRRAYLAQSYLHETLDRPIELDELSCAVGVSPFVLLRNFQHCFGETPASYHRKLRLTAAVQSAARRRLSLTTVCDSFGFAGISSFSHAYRRAFGVSWRGDDAPGEVLVCTKKSTR